MKEKNEDNTHTLVLNEKEFYWLFYFLLFKGVGHEEVHDILDKMK